MFHCKIERNEFLICAKMALKAFIHNLVDALEMMTKGFSQIHQIISEVMTKELFQGH